MALVADQLDSFPAGAATPSSSGNLADAAKQATKALKCVAFTTKQVGELLARKHERVLKRIGAISEEIESLKADVMENIAHQRERRTLLAEIEEDLEHAQLLGNGAVVEALYDELHVMKEETKREESLYRALCKTVRSRKESKKQFMQERLLVEEEMRTFAQKQKLIQTLLATCFKQSAAAADYTLASSASQSDCGASDLVDSDAEDEEDADHDESASRDGSSSSSGSFPENPLLDSPLLRAVEPLAARKDRLLAKAVSLMETGGAATTSPKQQLRVRSWSSDCVQPLPPSRESVQNRPRHSLSVHFASPVLTVSTIKTNDDELDNELASLDLSHYLSSVNKHAPPAEKTVPAPIKEEDAAQPEQAPAKMAVDAAVAASAASRERTRAVGEAAAVQPQAPNEKLTIDTTACAVTAQVTSTEPATLVESAVPTTAIARGATVAA